MSGSLAKKHIQIARQSRKRRSDGLTFLVELYMMTQDRRSDFVIAAILVAIAAAPLLVFAGVIGSTAAYPLNIASYAVAIQNQCTQDLQNKMNSLSFSAVDSICRCVGETLLKELSIGDIEGSSRNSKKVSRSLVDAYEICYLKALAP